MSTFSASDDVPYHAPSGAAATATRAHGWRHVPVAGAGVAAALAWGAFGWSCLWRDDVGDWSRTHDLAVAAFVIAALLGVATVAAVWFERTDGLRQRAPWFIVLGLFLTLWEVATAKLAWLPLPFFPPPQAIIEVYTDDLPKLAASVWASVKLQLGGYVIGAVAGFVTGVAIGWSRSVGYWVHPILRFIGPLPATAWLPIAFFSFPSSWSASTFLIALATGFPVTVLTWSGVASVSTAYYDVARTLGAKPSFLVLKVAIPAALPYVFVGLFMGLGASFAVLVVAEMMGVKAGLGWYLQWAQGWAAYANMYAALLVMSLLCSGAITLLFKARDRLLVWQKGVVKW
ncbi:ABC transporter permease subunit [Bradyrhizobium sp. U87765 SZCCT0131]|uniref:ABC transporter permease n=1 Tax=unclassified Bradyrhizobium TaxID=2631580 RepID=UPI001BAAE268|nr:MULTISPECIES: ABC transporter permease subunit [unclassified Bradyrhizobium]MBR1221387.1 ABC transporter permease subunit [Bradyrhizobium sp. U87765 SZCCT0131]MBR1264690.1 ABC transporter permease subunit [Bradyrhizobium sp. U87765 SZCCT0134]MBR1304404.1 ABC transporter permease subunit [Bradyrhizobium sp. U87765 SZCCT0110]MBR1322739.1 ABC transporter permease subunit [Bradyrhizobium sp. U87765 SZCCT0109]MBR1346333.1 ABC transporter permease subunit [Bradyrhizobium sp. U87765 SZCCT0048]